MAENSAIEWTDHTWNPWWGCTRVSPACEHCYAETWANRYGVGWGNQSPRRFFGEKHWNEPLKWDRKAKAAGVRKRVFCASMADVFEILPDAHPDKGQQGNERIRLLDLIEKTPNLDWLLLTKRPQNVAGLLDRWSDGYPDNVWIGTTVEDQRRAEERIPHLLRVPARVRFLSCEPLLERLDLSKYLHQGRCKSRGGGGYHDDGRPYTFRCGLPEGHDTEPHTALVPTAMPWFGLAEPLSWVIAGGESGPGARPSHPDWFRGLRDQCEAAGVPFHFKQFGDLVPIGHPEYGHGGGRIIALEDGMTYHQVGKHRAGRTLDGRTWDELPVSEASR